MKREKKSLLFPFFAHFKYQILCWLIVLMINKLFTTGREMEPPGVVTTDLRSVQGLVLDERRRCRSPTGVTVVCCRCGFHGDGATVQVALRACLLQIWSGGRRVEACGITLPGIQRGGGDGDVSTMRLKRRDPGRSDTRLLCFPPR